MTELAINTGTNFLTTEKYTAGLIKLLSISFMCMKGRDAFINGSFDYKGFKSWISTNPKINSKIDVEDIPDKYLKGITIDHDGLVCFGRRNYNQCTVSIDAPFITKTYHTGNKYVGEFADGLIHGQGTYTFSNGNIYVGEFARGLIHGQGTYTFLDGTKYTGIAQNGRNVEIERQIFIDLIMSKEKFTGQQINCFCKFMVHGYNSQDVTQLSTLNDLQQFYKKYIANNLVQLNGITKEELQDSITQDIIPENSMVLVLSSLVENQLEIITQNYLLNAMVASLTTTITDGGLNSKNYERSPINNLPISGRIISKSILTADFINSKKFLS